MLLMPSSSRTQLVAPKVSVSPHPAIPSPTSFHDGVPDIPKISPVGSLAAERIIARVIVWFSGDATERIDAEELGCSWIVDPSPEVDQSGVAAGVLGVVSERAGSTLRPPRSKPRLYES